jgi:type IV pilus assembly protein PilC
MAKFRYSAVNQSGKVIRGKIEASNRKDLDRRIARLGLSLISAEETKGLSTGGLFQKRVSRDDLAQFCFYVERLVAGGVPLLEGLADVRDSVSNAALRNTVGLLIEDVEQGNTLSAAMKRHPSIFDAVFVSLVEAGEHSGELDTVLRNLAENIKWQDDIIKKTKKVVRYPIFALFVMILATGMLLNFVVPGMVRILKSFGTELPVYTIALINTSDFLQEYILHLLGSIFAVWLVFYFSIKAIPGVDYFMDKAKIRIPIFGVVFEKLLLSRFANTFGMLYGSGVSVIEGLKISKGALGNRFMAKGLDGVIDSIVGGTSISNAFKESGLFPPLVLRMVRLGEATGGVDNAMVQVKNYYDRDANEAIETAQAAVGPIMLLFLAGLLVWVIIAVYGPLYSALGNLQT